MNLGPPLMHWIASKRHGGFAFFFGLATFAFYVLLFNKCLSWLLPFDLQRDLKTRTFYFCCLFFRKRASLSAEKKHISSHVYYKMAVDQAYVFALDLFLSLPKSIHMLLSMYQPPIAWLPLYSLVDPIYLLFISPSLRSNLSCSFKEISFLREICSASYL